MDTKTKLLDSAERVARERGYDGFSYADLAQAVGVRKASIHHHFATKSDLALSLIERYRQRNQEKRASIDQKAKSAAERLIAYIKHYRSATSGGTMLCLCVAFAVGRDRLGGPVLEQLDLFNKDSTLWLEDVFSRAKKDGSVAGVSDPKAEAAAVLALVEGAQLLARASGKVSSFDRALGQLKSRIRT